jgi:peptidoglycan/LPS O-acetylase OafA/YrhL
MNTAILNAPKSGHAESSTHSVSGNYYLSVGYLRAFVTLLVLAYHAALAYHPFAPGRGATLVAQPRWWEAFPVVDPHKWMGWSFFVGFNDVFFMSLMFFLSGLFVQHSIERKGVGRFLSDRLLRLGLPFVLAAAIIAPLAYYPAYLLTPAHAGIAGYWQQWRALGNWPAGPAWFIWVLLVFDVVAAALFAFTPKVMAWLGRVVPGSPNRPIGLFLIVAAVSAVTYIPMAIHFSAERWSVFGPFFFQTSRIFHYLAYFLIAIAVGATAMSRGFFARDGKLARRWPLWSSAMVLIYFVLAVAFIAMISGAGKSLPWGPLLGSLWVLSCAASCFGFMSFFARFATKRRAVFDSLTDNAYGMYLIHYAFVSWLQYALLPASLSGFVKGVLVTLGTIILSWGTTAALRRIPAVARVI